MGEAIVARHGQVTLSKEIRDKLSIREGDKVIVNHENGLVIISKKDPNVWDKLGSFLPDNFEKILAEIRNDSNKRFKDIGLI